MSKAHPSISVVIPVYNEAAEIANIVESVGAALTARGGEYEVIVVDNASEDDTVERLQPFLADKPVRLLRNEHNMGKGYSVRRGMLEANGDLRLMCDADCAPSLQSLPKMEAMLADCDIVAGARNAPTSEVGRQQPLRRRAASIGFILLCRAVMSEPLKDVFCGFKLFTADAAQDVFSRARIDGWAFDAEALAIARRRVSAVTGIDTTPAAIPNTNPNAAPATMAAASAAPPGHGAAEGRTGNTCDSRSSRSAVRRDSSRH